jgi:hypothetical protein
MTISDGEILAATGLDKVLGGAGNRKSETEEVEEAESTEAQEEVTDSESVEQDDTGEAATDEEDALEESDEEESKDDGIYLDYTASGQSKRVNLKDPNDLTRVKTALEKEGLEVTAQRHAEARKQVEDELRAARAKLREYEITRESDKVLEPYMRLIKDPVARQRIAAMYKMPQVDYNPTLAKERAENAVLRQRQMETENQTELASIETQLRTDLGLDDGQLNECVGYLREQGLGYDANRPIREQRAQIVALVRTAHNALIGQGKLPNPEVLKAKAEKEDIERQLEAARKRRSKRSPTSGTGAIGSGAGKTTVDLKGASTSDLLAYYKKRTGKT